MYGVLPSTGGFVNPLQVLYLTIAVAVFGGGWLMQKVRGRQASPEEE